HRAPRFSATPGLTQDPGNRRQQVTKREKRQRPSGLWPLPALLGGYSYLARAWDLATGGPGEARHLRYYYAASRLTWKRRTLAAVVSRGLVHPNYVRATSREERITIIDG